MGSLPPCNFFVKDISLKLYRVYQNNSYIRGKNIMKKEGLEKLTLTGPTEGKEAKEKKNE